MAFYCRACRQSTSGRYCHCQKGSFFFLAASLITGALAGYQLAIGYVDSYYLGGSALFFLVMFIYCFYCRPKPEQIEGETYLVTYVY